MVKKTEQIVSKEDFQEYVRVQKSGVTNMFMISTVCELTGLEKEQVMYIMKHYPELEEDLNKEVGK